MWLWMVVLSIYTILKPSLILTPSLFHLGTLDHCNTMDIVFAVIFGGLVIWSFAVWVVDPTGSLRTTSYRKLRKAMAAIATDWRRISREAEEERKISDMTTPLLSTADDAVFRITPVAARFAAFLASLPIPLLFVYTCGYFVNKQYLWAFLNENLAFHICLLACWSVYGMLTSPGFKYDIDRIYRKIKVEKDDAVHDSTATDAGMQTATAASHSCAICKGTGRMNLDERHGEFQGSEVDMDFDGDNFDVLDDPSTEQDTD